MANTKFFVSILVSLIAATAVVGAVMGSLVAQTVPPDGVQYAGYTLPTIFGEAQK